MSLTVGVKFCGNCNPQIDTAGLLTKLKKSRYSFVPWSESNYHVLLILSACPTDCATRPPFYGPVLSVAGGAVDGYCIPERQLPDLICQRLEGFEGAGTDNGRR